MRTNPVPPRPVQRSMRRILLALSLLTAVSSYALTVDQMLARFNKVKQKSKHKHGVVMETYVNVQRMSAPIVV